MNARRITAAICLAAIVLLVMAAFTNRWLVADLRSPEINGSIRIGLTGVSACMATAEISQCESTEWSTLQRQFGGRIEGGSWMWLGRLTFAVCLIAAAALLAVGVIAAIPLELGLPIPLPRVAMWASIAVFPLMGGYYALTPNLFSSIGAGRGFAFAALGAIAGIVAAFREQPDSLA